MNEQQEHKMRTLEGLAEDLAKDCDRLERHNKKLLKELNAIKNKGKLRDESTPEGKAMWEAVDKAAARAPSWWVDQQDKQQDCSPYRVSYLIALFSEALDELKRFRRDYMEREGMLDEVD